MDLAGEMAWMAEISRRNGVPVTYQVLQADFAPDLWRSWIDAGLNANRAGAWLVPQVAGKPASVLIGFESSFHPFVRNPAYLPLADLPHAELVAALRTPEVRDAILAEETSLGGMMAVLMANTHKVFPLGDPVDYEPAPDKSVAAIAEREGRPVLEVMYDLMLRHDGTELLYMPLLGYAGSKLSAIEEMLNHPATVLGLGDGGAHCGVLCDASLPTFMLTHWTRDRDRGDRLGLEQVVHHQTARTAALYGFGDRGLLAPGMLADVNVIDYDALALHRPRMAYDLPAGGKRLVQAATGYAATVKSGVVVREDDQATGERPGGLVRGPQARPTAATIPAGAIR
jgi:N-acyl-D-aspartate/D-glutamate deacylase